MIVTQIVPLNKIKSKIYIDQEFAFVLYKGEIRNYSISEENEISELAYNQIIMEVLPKRAKLRAMNLLKARDYTTEQLRRKLKEGNYPEEIIQLAIEYVSSYHYIDDERYTRDYITCHLRSNSRKKIEMALQLKGIKKDMINYVFDELQEEGMNDTEEEQILLFLEKKQYSSENIDEKKKQKIVASLYRKGYSLDKIYKVIGKSYEKFN